MRSVVDIIAKMANNAIMSVIHDIYGLQRSEELKSSPASKLKNEFKPVFQRVLSEGAVSITRNRRPEAVLISTELYDRMIAELEVRDPLEVLRREYDERLALMQTGKSRRAYEKAFGASSEELGKVAVRQAKK